MKKLLWGCFVSTVIFCCLPCIAQKESPYANAWQTTVQPEHKEAVDQKSQEDLAARGALFDSLAPGDSSQVVSDSTKPSWHSSPGSRGPRIELPISESDVIAVIRFDTFIFHLTPSHRSVYTELVFKPSQIIYTRTGASLTKGYYPILEAGGTIQSSEKVHRSPVALREYGPKPNHSYVVFLRYNSTGDFYELLKAWDITTGIAMPTSSEDVALAQTHKSLYAGRPVSSLIEAIQNKLPKQ